MHKVSIESVRLYDFSRRNIVDAEKMAESVDSIYALENGWVTDSYEQRQKRKEDRIKQNIKLTLCNYIL